MTRHSAPPPVGCCPICGAETAPEDQFCGDCGHRLAPQAKPAKVEPAATASRKGRGRDDRAKLNDIAEAYQRGELQPSRERLLAYLRDYPEDATAWSILCNVEDALGHDQQAEQACRQAIAVDPACYTAYNNLGRLYRQRRDYGNAMTCYERSLAIAPDNAYAYSGMSVVELSRRHNERALELAKRAYELDTNDAIIASNLALACHYCHRFDERDRMKEVAHRLGYRNMAALERIFRGEVSVQD